MVKPGMPYFEAIALGLSEKDLLMIRTDQALTEEERQTLEQAIRRSNPHWRGPMLLLGTDQMIEKLPEETLRELRGTLNAMFERWEQWARDQENGTERCTRCQQPLVKRRRRAATPI